MSCQALHWLHVIFLFSGTLYCGWEFQLLKGTEKRKRNKQCEQLESFWGKNVKPLIYSLIHVLSCNLGMIGSPVAY